MWRCSIGYWPIVYFDRVSFSYFFQNSCTDFYIDFGPQAITSIWRGIALESLLLRCYLFSVEFDKGTSKHQVVTINMSFWPLFTHTHTHTNQSLFIESVIVLTNWFQMSSAQLNSSNCLVTLSIVAVFFSSSKVQSKHLNSRWLSQFF